MHTSQQQPRTDQRTNFMQEDWAGIFLERPSRSPSSWFDLLVNFVSVSNARITFILRICWLNKHLNGLIYVCLCNSCRELHALCLLPWFASRHWTDTVSLMTFWFLFHLVFVSCFILPKSSTLQTACNYIYKFTIPDIYIYYLYNIIRLYGTKWQSTWWQTKT